MYRTPHTLIYSWLGCKKYLNNIENPSSYLTGNTLHLYSNDQLFREIIAVYCENHTEHINTLCGQNAVYTNPVRTSQETYSVSITKTYQLTLFREMITVYCEIHTEQVNTQRGQNVELINVEAGGTYNYHCALKLIQWRCSEVCIFSILILIFVFWWREEFLLTQTVLWFSSLRQLSHLSILSS
jgi:hypothetical protein